MNRKNTAAWMDIGGKRHYFRSLWERNFCRWLQFQKDKGVIHDWEYESKTFWFMEIKRGVRSYLPDFKVYDTPGEYHWVEVKGFMDSKSCTKLKRMSKYYPNERIILIDSKWFYENSSKLKKLIPSWEIGESKIKRCKGDQYV